MREQCVTDIMPTDNSTKPRRSRLAMNTDFRFRCNWGWKNDLFDFARQKDIDAADLVRLSTRHLIESARKDPGILTELYARPA
jgi:hypothetical protein